MTTYDAAIWAIRILLFQTPGVFARPAALLQRAEALCTTLTLFISTVLVRLGGVANGRWRKFDLYSSVLIRNWSADRRKAVLERGLLLGGLMNRRNPCYQTNFTRRGTCRFICHRSQQHHDCAHHEHFQRLCNRQWCCSHATVTVV
jgi:hypothetical protein